MRRALGAGRVAHPAAAADGNGGARVRLRGVGPAVRGLDDRRAAVVLPGGTGGAADADARLARLRLRARRGGALGPSRRCAAGAAIDSAAAGAARCAATAARSADRAGSRMRNAARGRTGRASRVCCSSAAALLVQSVSHTLNADLGFRTKDACCSRSNCRHRGRRPPPRAYYDEARARIGALPGVESAGWTRALTLARTSRRGFQPEGYTPRPARTCELNVNYASTRLLRDARHPAAGRPHVLVRGHGTSEPRRRGQRNARQTVLRRRARSASG